MKIKKYQLAGIIKKHLVGGLIGKPTKLIKGIGLKIYETVTPKDYNIPKAIYEYISGKPRDFNAVDPVSNEMWAKYLGAKYNGNSELEPAIYLPIRGTSPYTMYKFKDESKILSDEVLDRMLEYLKKTGKSSMVIPGNGEGMGSYTISLGKDKKGNYISYYDEWDINPFKGISSKIHIPIISEIENLIPFTNPFSLYGRRYYKERGQQQVKKLIKPVLPMYPFISLYKKYLLGGLIKKLQEGGWFSDAANSVWDFIKDNGKDIAGTLLSILDIKSNNGAIDAAIEAERQLSKVDAALQFKDNYLKFLLEGNDRSLIVNMSNAWKRASGQNYFDPDLLKRIAKLQSKKKSIFPELLKLLVPILNKETEDETVENDNETNSTSFDWFLKDWDKISNLLNNNIDSNTFFNIPSLQKWDTKLY